MARLSKINVPESPPVPSTPENVEAVTSKISRGKRSTRRIEDSEDEASEADSSLATTASSSDSESSDDSDIFTNSPLKRANRRVVVDKADEPADEDDLESTLKALSISADTKGPSPKSVIMDKRPAVLGSQPQPITVKQPVINATNSPVKKSVIERDLREDTRGINNRPTATPSAGDKTIARSVKKPFNTSDPLRKPQGMLARLQQAQDSRNRLLARNGVDANGIDLQKPDISPSKPVVRKTTFGSPVRQFQSGTGSLMEPVTPRSSQWQRKVDVELLRNAKPIALGSPEKDFNSALLREPLRWGTKSASAKNGGPPRMGSPQAKVTLIDGNMHAYISADKVTEQLKDLLETVDKKDEEEEQIEEKDKVVAGLNVKLLPHQVKGYRFLLGREKEDLSSKGGLLCDDMGLGKTVQSIALILGNPHKHGGTKQESTEPPPEQKEGEKPLPPPIKTTLVVAPLALATQWAAEVRSKAPGLKVYIHHGSSRAKDSKCFEKYDVVVTTFQVVTSEHALDGPLFEPHWWRIIVDEAHTIKNRSAKSSIGATSLTSQRRWCLTGTPIQNNVDELYSLFRFIQLKPYDKYQIWSGQIAGPINAGRGKVAMQRLHAVLGAVMLRRTKEVLKTSGVVLPARRVHRVLVEFSTREREVYDHLHRRVGQRIEKMILEGGGSQYMSALLQLLRLRQICDDLRLVTGRLDEDDRSAVVDASSENVDDLADMLKSLDVNRDLEDVQVQDQVQEEPMDTPSAKIIKLVSLLKSELSRKTIVFSQFTSMLDIMEPHLHHEGIRFVRYDGSMTPAKRDESLNALRNNPDVEVLLCSLKCGALGLNLTCASRVILVDPWWNPMISEQAIDRVHRLGQTHDVDVYELIVNKTVEQKICSLCDSKRQLASGVIDGAQSSAVTNKLSKAELLDLFN